MGIDSRVPPTPSMTDRASQSAGTRPAQDGRSETQAERIDRNLSELFEELRVAVIAAQVLFGFLLSIPFTPRFTELDDSQQALFTADLVLAAVATTLLVGPVAYHRLRFHAHAKES